MFNAYVIDLRRRRELRRGWALCNNQWIVYTFICHRKRDIYDIRAMALAMNAIAWWSSCFIHEPLTSPTINRSRALYRSMTRADKLIDYGIACPLKNTCATSFVSSSNIFMISMHLNYYVYLSKSASVDKVPEQFF